MQTISSRSFGTPNLPVNLRTPSYGAPWSDSCSSREKGTPNLESGADFASESSISSTTQETTSSAEASLAKAWTILNNADSWLDQDDFSNTMAQGMTSDVLKLLDHREVDDITKQLKIYSGRLFASLMSSH